MIAVNCLTFKGDVEMHKWLSWAKYASITIKNELVSIFRNSILECKQWRISLK